MKSELEIKNLSYSYHSLEGETLTLSDISFDINNGEFLAIVGPSGCGRSTLLSLLTDLLEPEEGSILINDIPREDNGVQIDYMLQKDHLFDWRNILSSVSLGLEVQHRLGEAKKERLLEILDTCGLTDFRNSRPSELSDGMRQRAALIRTLALKPDILLLDEPFSVLDYQARLKVCDGISSIIKKGGKTAILITHDLSEAVSVADRIIILTSRPGKIKGIMDVPFGEEYTRPLERKSAPEFSSCFNQLWKEPQNHD